MNNSDEIDLRDGLFCEVRILEIVNKIKDNNTCICPVCNYLFDKININEDIESYVRQHIINHYNLTKLKGIIDIMFCDNCNMEFYDEFELNNHINTVHNNNENELTEYSYSIDIFEDDPNDPNYDMNSYDNYDPYYERDSTDIYCCKKCFYNTNCKYTLINHYSYKHVEELLNPDKQLISSVSFPGFELLLNLGIIKYLSWNTFRNNKKYDTDCSICLDEFSNFHNPITDDIYDYNSNSIVNFNYNTHNIHIINNDKLSNNKFSYKKIFNCDLQNINTEKFITKTIKKPIILNCCNNIICDSCIINHINSHNGSIICPFCRSEFNDKLPNNRSLITTYHNKPQIYSINTQYTEENYSFSDSETDSDITSDIDKAYNNTTINPNRTISYIYNIDTDTFIHIYEIVVQNEELNIFVNLIIQDLQNNKIFKDYY